MNHVKPRVSENPVGPFAAKEANTTLMHILGRLWAHLRAIPISEATRDRVEDLVREAKNEIQCLATGEPKRRQKDVNEAMKLLTRTLDHTYLHHLSKNEQELFCKWLLEIMNEDYNLNRQSNYFSKTVFEHIRQLAHLPTRL